MASVHKQAQGKSPFWYCRYVTAGGQQRMKSTQVRIKEDPKGKRAQLICQGWQDAEDALRDGNISRDRILELYNDALKRAGLKTIDLPSVGVWMKDWLESKRKIAKSTRIAYEQAVREFLEFLGPAGAHRKLENITEKDIDAFANKLIREHRSPNTVNKLIRKYLSGPFEKARKLGKIKYNPIAATDPLEREEHVKDIFSPEQVGQLVRAAAPDRDWALAILLAYGSGARLQDICNMRWGNLDLANGLLVFKERKGKRENLVGLHPDFIECLDERTPIKDPNAFLFPTLANRSGAGRNGLSKAFERIMQKAGIGGKILKVANGKGRSIRSLSFHSFRHTAASSVFNSEALKEAARRVTNHARGGVVDRYLHRDVEALKAAVNAIPRLPK
jgi:integrase